MPISDKHIEYTKQIAEKLKQNEIRVKLNLESESLGKKIRKAEQDKIPYILVVGDKEKESNSVAVRKRGEDKKPSKAADKQNIMKIDEFVEMIKKEIEEKK